MPLESVLQSFVTSRDEQLDFGAPQLSRERVRDWLKTRAPDELAEVWAYGRINERVQAHREREPRRIPMLEAFSVRRAMRDVEKIEADARKEIRCLVEKL
jgi:hypothetical protein